MSIFYNIASLAIGIMAILMFRFGTGFGDDRQEFRSASRVLSILYLFTGLSIFMSQFEPRLPTGEFQMLNPLIILFFCMVAHGFIYTLLLLYKSPYAVGYLKKTIPVFMIFGLYTLAYFVFGDPSVYSTEELLQRLLQEPMLIFRCMLLAVTLISVAIGLRLYNRACIEYNRRIAESFSDEDFQRSIVVSRFMWSLKALAIWVVLTYFYTTPVLEAVSCSLIAAVYFLQLIGIRNYLRSSNYKIISSATLLGEIDFEVDNQELEMRRRITAWSKRADKPFTKPGLTISDVAKDIGVSKTKLSEYVNSTGENYNSWINGMRIEEAKSLLVMRKGLSVSEIAEFTGFCDLPAFSRAFKKATDLSPKQFRNNMLE